MRKLTPFFLFAIIIGAFAFCDLPAHALVMGDVAPDVLHAVVLPALLKALLDPTVWAAVFGVLYAVAAHYKWSRLQKVKAAVETVFHVVEDLKATGVLPAGADKPTVALEKLEEVLSHDSIDVTPAVAALAKASWSAMHGQQATAAVVSAP